MTRQALIRVLLSLLLLVSQQMASMHVLSHLGGALAGSSTTLAPSADDGLASAVATDETCSHCLAFAQLAGPVGSTPPAFIIPDAGTSPVVAAAAHDAGARTNLAFNSRGPPLA